MMAEIAFYSVSIYYCSIGGTESDDVFIRCSAVKCYLIDRMLFEFSNEPDFKVVFRRFFFLRIAGFVIGH